MFQRADTHLLFAIVRLYIGLRSLLAATLCCLVVRPCTLPQSQPQHVLPTGPLFSQLSSLRSFLRELRPLLGSAGTTAALTAVDELQALGQLLLDWGVARDQLLLEPLLTPQAEYFSGTLFQVRVCVLCV